MTAIDAGLLRPLDRVRRPDALACGNKAATLGELSALGYRVPSFAVLPTTAYEAFVAVNGLQEATDEWRAEAATARPARLVEIERACEHAFASASLPAGLAVEIDRWFAGFAVTRIAVRSSATMEDRSGSSFAGQYSSFLDVAPDGVHSAIAGCFASLFAARATLYRRAKKLSGADAMAVILQHMVTTDTAGVVFTRAPGRAGTLLIECARGGCDGIVAGTTAPSRYYLERASLQIVDAMERHDIDPSELRAIAAQALGIERDLGGSQDVEYGTVRGAVHIFQARPAPQGTTTS